MSAFHGASRRYMPSLHRHVSVTSLHGHVSVPSLMDMCLLPHFIDMCLFSHFMDMEPAVRSVPSLHGFVSVYPCSCHWAHARCRLSACLNVILHLLLTVCSSCSFVIYLVCFSTISLQLWLIDDLSVNMLFCLQLVFIFSEVFLPSGVHNMLSWC